MSTAQRKLILLSRSRGESFAKIGEKVGLTAKDLGFWFKHIGSKLRADTIGEDEQPPDLVGEGVEEDPESVRLDPEIAALVQGATPDDLKATAEYLDRFLGPRDRARLLSQLARAKKSPSTALAALKLAAQLKAEDKAKPPPAAPLFALPTDAFPDMGGRPPSK